MKFVNSSQSAWFQMCCWKLSEKVGRPVRQAHSRLSLESCTADQPVNLILSEEPDSPVLPCRLPLGHQQLFLQSYSPMPNLFESLKIKFSYMRTRTFEDLAELVVAHVRDRRHGGHQRPELQTYDAIDLLFRVLLHLFFLINKYVLTDDDLDYDDNII